VAPRLLIATNNPGKIDNFRALLADTGWDLVTPAEVGIDLEVDESGTSYAENARIKARAFVAASGLPSLADDSGLEVDALGGEPGPLHHLKGWDGADNDERIRILLEAMKGKHERSARFKAVIVVALPDGHELLSEGECAGVISETPRGHGGFGYDPVFLVPELGKTMAELAPAEKNRISHRARAAQAIRGRLRELAEA
jgi:XTP/dITP diphosphohydrolase